MTQHQPHQLHQSHRLLTRELIVDAAYFLWFYAITALAAFVLSGDIIYAYAMLMLALPFYFTFIIRSVCQKASSFLFLHLLLIAGVYVALNALTVNPLPPAAEWHLIRINPMKPCGLVFMVVTSVYSFRARFPKRDPVIDMGTAVFSLLTLAAACLYCEYRQFHDLRRIMAVSVILLSALQLTASQMRSMDRSMELASMNATQPVSEILSAGNRLILVFSGLLAVVAAAVYLFGLDAGLTALWSWIGRRLYAALKFLFNRAPQEPEPEPVPIEYEPDIEPDLSEMLPLEEIPPTPAWMEMLEKIISYTAAVLLSAFLIGVLVYGCWRLHQLFYKPRVNKNGDIRESLLPDLAEQTALSFFSDIGPANRIRRLFYRTVRRHIRRNILPEPIQSSDSAAEIAQKIKASENIDALTAQYEQVRYGKE